MRANPLIDAMMGDPEENADFRRRRFINRGLILLALAIAIGTLSYLVFHVSRHMMASYWLMANHFTVDWDFDQENRSRGGSTAIKAGIYESFFAGNDPNAVPEIPELDSSGRVARPDSGPRT